MQATAAADCETGLRTTAATVCRLCGQRGRWLYRGLSDTRGRAPGAWNWRRCGACGLLWLDPRPAVEHIGRLYECYYTHEQGPPAGVWPRLREYARLALLSSVDGYESLAGSRCQRLLGRLALAVPLLGEPLAEMARLGLLGLGPAANGKLLDVGCGSGRFLALLRRAGWQVSGIEPDPLAAAAARERYGIEVLAGSIEAAGLPAHSFDAVVLSHVVEHVSDPAALLAACRRLLRPGGRLALSTPNAESRGHRRFGAAWLHLDVPRHLFLFSAPALAALLERAGFERFSIASAAKSAASTWLSSAAAGPGPPPRPLDYARALGFHLAQWRALSRGGAGGEELFAWATASLTTAPAPQKVSAPAPPGRAGHDHASTRR